MFLRTVGNLSTVDIQKGPYNSGSSSQFPTLPETALLPIGHFVRPG